MKIPIMRQKRFPWTAGIHAVLGMFCDDSAGWRTVHFPGQSLHGQPLFRTCSFPVRPFPSLGHSGVCVGPHPSSPLELLTHNLLLAPAGVC